MASFEASHTAPVKWAQRTDSLYVTISLADVKDHHIDVSATTVTFKGKANGDKDYNVTLEFFKEIETDGSVWNVLPASVQMKLNKKAKGEEFWPRLLKDKALEKTNVTVDWDRYVDEDEQDGDFDTSNLDDGMGFGGTWSTNDGRVASARRPHPLTSLSSICLASTGGMGGGMGDMDFSKMMAGMGGMGGGMPPGGFGGDDDDDVPDSDDDEDLPDLEDTDAPTPTATVAPSSSSSSAAAVKP